MPERTKRVHVTASDGARLLQLAMEILDRSDEEHDALMRLAEKLDRRGIACGSPEVSIVTWVGQVEATRELQEDPA